MTKENQQENGGSFLAPVKTNAMAELSKGVRAQEVQAALVIAKHSPRDPNAAYVRIMQACEQKQLAKDASYVFSRGGSPIDGATIDLLEVIAQNWGNMQSGVVELEQREGESTMLAFAWDLETNFYDSKTFTVRHRRTTRTSVTELTDDRDIYENSANFAARRKRACMEAVIPRWLVDSAREKCDETLRKSETEPLAERVRKMAFAYSEMGVTVEMIEKKLNHKLEAVVEQEFVLLRKMYKSIRDGMSKRTDWFDFPSETDKAPSTPKRENAPKDEHKEANRRQAEEVAKVEAEVKADRAAEAAAKDAKKEEPAKTETPPKGEEDFHPATEKPAVAVTIDRSKPFDTLRELAKANNIAPAQVLAYAKTIRAAKPSHTELGEMRESDLLRIVDAWGKVLPDIQKVQVPK